MLPGNMSSTASALVNMTNSTIHSSLLRVADPADDSSSSLGTKAVLTIMLFIGFAIYLMRHSYLQQVLNTNQPPRHLKPETKSLTCESTPLLKEEIGSNARRSLDLEAAMNRLRGEEPSGAIEIQMNEIDLSRYLVKEETKIVPHNNRKSFG